VTATLEVDEVEPAASGPAPGHRHLAYNPAIDGIRGLAVGAVLLFHNGFPWARGGYLGVSTFFTLSGFLITSLLVGEHQRSGRIGLTGFWARRMRRLLPASALTLGALLASMLIWDDLWQKELPGDVVASVLQVANWHFLIDDRSYGALFAAPSPALHFWSLAIEEQFYWVFPLLTAGILYLARGSLRIYAGVLVGLLALSGVLTLVYRDRPDTVYYATPIRMGEILVGALLAVAVSRGLLVGSARLRPLIVALGVVALAVSVWSWWNVEQSSTILTRGFLLAYAGASGCLVLAACVPGPLRRALSFEPLRLLGLVSYGVYLFHWPIYLVLSRKRADDLFDPFGWQPRGWGLLAVRLVPTLALAVLSYWLVEQPIRRARWFRLPGLAPSLAFGSIAAVVAVAVVVPTSVPPPKDQFQSTLEAMAEANRKIAAREAAMPADAVHTMFFGDSAALTMAAGTGEWGLRTKKLLLVGDGDTTQLGCGIGRGGERRQFGQVSTVPDTCLSWDTDWAAEVAASKGLQVAVLLTGSWDVIDRKLPGDDRWRGFGDPVYDDYMRGEIEGATEALLAKGLTVVWLTTPPLHFGSGMEPPPEHQDPLDAPQRIAVLNGIIRDVAATHPHTAVIEFGKHFADMPPAENDRLRPDGVHVDLTKSYEVARWLGPKLMAAIQKVGGPVPDSGK
jgi:peptidoglycan/LPS O-acetylase OafA/YrhL